MKSQKRDGKRGELLSPGCPFVRITVPPMIPLNRRRCSKSGMTFRKFTEMSEIFLQYVEIML